MYPVAVLRPSRGGYPVDVSYVGTGGYPVGLGDFQSHSGDPDFMGAWNDINNQLTSEGASPADVDAAQTAFASSFETLASQESGSIGSDVISAAKQYVMQGSTVAGAVEQIGGLIQAGQNGMPPAALMQSFTGVMIGAMVAAGAVSAGLGAAIIGAADLVISLLSQAGLFGSAPSGQQFCPGSYYNGPGSISYLLPGQVNPQNSQVNCIGVLDPYWDSTKSTGVSPQSTRWRRFPLQQPSVGLIQPPDNVWYLTQANEMTGATVSWQPANDDQATQYFIAGGTVFPNPGLTCRAIDAAFPMLHHLECEAAAGAGAIQASGIPVQQVAAMQAFVAAFAAALKTNWEYALNGLKPLADWQVLAHMIRLWNRAHDSSSTYTLKPSGASVWTPNGTQCQGNPPLYSGIVVSGIITNPVQDIMSSDGSGVVINTGSAKNVGFIGSGSSAGATGASTTSTTSTGATVAIGTVVVAGAGAAALGIYSYITKQSYGAAASHLWDRVKGTFRRKPVRGKR